jgi:hypothetical protein
MQSLSTAPFNPASGIDRILRQSSSQVFLPQYRSLQPAEVSERPHLEQLFPLNSINDFVEKRLRPQLQDAGMLSPTEFRSALSDTRTRLRFLAKAHPKSSRQLGRLACLLEEEGDLIGLLQMYCSALIQG